MMASPKRAHDFDSENLSEAGKQIEELVWKEVGGVQSRGNGNEGKDMGRCDTNRTAF